MTWKPRGTDRQLDPPPRGYGFWGGRSRQPEVLLTGDEAIEKIAREVFDDAQGWSCVQLDANDLREAARRGREHALREVAERLRAMRLGLHVRPEGDPRLPFVGPDALHDVTALLLEDLATLTGLLGGDPVCALQLAQRWGCAASSDPPGSPQAPQGQADSGTGNDDK